MFENCSIFILAAGEHDGEVYRLTVDADTQKAICKSFSTASRKMIVGKSKIPFTGSYVPLEDEVLEIQNFRLDDKIKEAVKNPLGTTLYTENDGIFPEIKAIFVGLYDGSDGTDNFIIAFQRFRKDQYISPSKFHLFFDKKTFQREKNYGITISPSIDCLYKIGSLFFNSYYFARQVFDLMDYYREATESDVDDFTASDKLSFENPESFKGNANSWIRRKIASINDSCILENYSASQIKAAGTRIGLNIQTNNKKIVIPKDKEDIKILLGFLDEEAYKGPFSKQTFLANSKRSIKS